MSSLAIRRIDRDDVSILHLEGSLDETATLDWSMFRDTRPTVRIHLRGVSRMNSCGVREWIDFVSSAPENLRVEYEQCSAAFMRQMNLIANFLGRGELRSYMLPFCCQNCDFEIEELVRCEDESTEAPRPRGCPSCAGMLEPDFLASRLLTDRLIREPLKITIAVLERVVAALFGSASTGVILVNSEARIAYWNDAVQSLLMLRPHETRGALLDEVVRFEVDDVAVDVLEGPGPIRWREVTLPRVPGGSFLVEVTPIAGVGTLIAFLDLTLEATLHRRYRALWTEERHSRMLLAEQNVVLQQRNRELDESRQALQRVADELRSAQAQTVVAERLAALAQLSGALAHEVNNPAAAALVNLVEIEDRLRPLASVKALLDREATVESIMEVVGGTAFRDLLQTLPGLVSDALEATRMVGNLTRDLKSLMHRGPGDERACDVNSLLGTAIRLIRSELVPSTKMTRDLGEIPGVEADESRLTQVFVNLLLNAAHAFGPEATAPEIRVVSAVRDQQVVVSITDNGDGMTEGVRARLFEPFFTTRPQGQGTGLGMAVVQKILTELGGSIEVDSAPGRGTTVRVSLPASASRPSVPEQGKPSAGPRLRVLVVDDDPLVRRAMRRVLEPHHDVTVVGGGMEALQTLAAGTVFDVALVDLMMDDLSGAELIRHIENDFSSAVRQIVILTGGTALSIAGDFLSETRYPVLAKPIEPRVLLEAIARLGG